MRMPRANTAVIPPVFWYVSCMQSTEASSRAGADPDLERRFTGIRRLYGEQALARFRQARVCVLGIGGVGSWAAEALARSAIGHITLIDLDHVAESNINRQCHALDSTLGMAKVRVMAARIQQINPAARSRPLRSFSPWRISKPC